VVKYFTVLFDRSHTHTHTHTHTHVVQETFQSLLAYKYCQGNSRL